MCQEFSLFFCSFIFWDIWKYLSPQIPFLRCYLLLCSRCFHSGTVTTAFLTANRDIAASLTFQSSLHCCCNPDSTARSSSCPPHLKANTNPLHQLSSPGGPGFPGLAAMVHVFGHADQSEGVVDAQSHRRHVPELPPKLYPSVQLLIHQAHNLT